jgi:hypothetical protein
LAREISSSGQTSDVAAAASVLASGNVFGHDGSGLGAGAFAGVMEAVAAGAGAELSGGAALCAL